VSQSGATDGAFAGPGGRRRVHADLGREYDQAIEVARALRRGALDRAWRYGSWRALSPPPTSTEVPATPSRLDASGALSHSRGEIAPVLARRSCSPTIGAARIGGEIEVLSAPAIPAAVLFYTHPTFRGRGLTMANLTTRTGLRILRAGAEMTVGDALRRAAAEMPSGRRSSRLA
jgi:hypothetical protein